MSAEGGALGTFADPARAAGAIRSLRARGFEVRAGMPAPFAEVVEALGRPRSPIALAALPGAAAGIAGGLLLAVLTSLSWPLLTGGKPIVSMPPFLVISFEIAVLVGSLANLAAVGLGIWAGGRARAFPAHLCFDGRRIGVWARGGDPALAARTLREGGAEEVSDVP